MNKTETKKCLEILKDSKKPLDKVTGTACLETQKIFFAIVKKIAELEKSLHPAGHLDERTGEWVRH